MATQIKAIEVAEHASDLCPTCQRRADLPYRVVDARGHVLQGCVANFHTGHIFSGKSAQWHDSPVAKQIRRDTAAFYKVA